MSASSASESALLIIVTTDPQFCEVLIMKSNTEIVCEAILSFCIYEKSQEYVMHRLWSTHD